MQASRAANICALQSGWFCQTIRETFRTFKVKGGSFQNQGDFFKFAHQNMERLVYFQGTFCRVTKSWQLGNLTYYFHFATFQNLLNK